MRIYKNHFSGDVSFCGETHSISCDCDRCEFRKVDAAYIHIIGKLKRHDLLPEKFPYICCSCWKMMGFFGQIHCPECGGYISYYEQYIGEHYIYNIRCINDNCGYNEYLRVKAEGNKFATFRFNPIKIILEEFCSE